MPAGGRRTASEALQFGFQYINRVPYVWGGGALPPPGQSGGGIDCSHFVWRCFNYPNYYTTNAMVTTNCLAQYDFIKMSYSYSTVEEGDIVVFDGHTGIACGLAWRNRRRILDSYLATQRRSRYIYKKIQLR